MASLRRPGACSARSGQPFALPEPLPRAYTQRCFWVLEISMRMRTWLLSAMLPWALVGQALSSEFLFAVGDATARVEGPFQIPVRADAPFSYQGFSLALRYPADEISVDRVSVQGTILEALGADFVHGEVLPGFGIINVAVLVDALPPFDGALIPAVGFPLDLFHLDGDVLRQTPGEVAISFVTPAARPAAAVATLFSVDNAPVAPDRLLDGLLRVELPPLVPAFIRGDANLDRSMDISDPILVLAWRFLGGPGLRCDDAADANADDAVDVSDAVFLLAFLFMDGARPFPPQGRPGPDPFLRGELGCREPIDWIPAQP